MIQRQNKNNDLIIQVEGTGISQIEYYTDGLYKYVVNYSPTVCIPSQELLKMNDGQLKSTVYLSEINTDFPDGTKDRTINQTFEIWIYGNSTSNQYPTKEELSELYYTKEEIDAKIVNSGNFDSTQYYTKEDIENKCYLTEDELDDYVTEEQLDAKGYITDLSNYALKSEIPDTSNLATKDDLYDDTDLTNRVSAIETSLAGVESILQEING